jgi:hypothetical protein
MEIKLLVLFVLLTFWYTVATITNMTRSTIPMSLTLTNWNPENNVTNIYFLYIFFYLHYSNLYCFAATSLYKREKIHFIIIPVWYTHNISMTNRGTKRESDWFLNYVIMYQYATIFRKWILDVNCRLPVYWLNTEYIK